MKKEGVPYVMNELKSNSRMIGGSGIQSRNTSNVSTYVRREEKTYVRRYSMTKKRLSKWIEENTDGDEEALLHPSLRKFKAQEAVMDQDKRKKAKILIVSLCIAVLMLLSVLVLQITVTNLVIKEIRVEGSVYYSEAELLEVTGLKLGDGLPIFRTSEAEASVVNSLSYLKSCEIDFELPNVLIFRLSDETPTVYTKIDGEYYILTSSMRVLERTENADKQSGLLYVELPRVSKAMVGEEIVLEGTSTEYITEFFRLIEGSDLKDRLGIVYFDKKFDIVASIDGKYRVLFGSPSEMSLKIASVAKMIEDNQSRCLGSGIIDVRVTDVCGIILDADIDPQVRE